MGSGMDRRRRSAGMSFLPVTIWWGALGIIWGPVGLGVLRIIRYWGPLISMIILGAKIIAFWIITKANLIKECVSLSLIVYNLV